jgi:hypothetical protein
MASVHTDTEREVEMHFASPLFREGLGYSEDQDAAGFAIQAARGSCPGHIEADLLYFADGKHDVKEGEPLVLMECKRLLAGSFGDLYSRLHPGLRWRRTRLRSAGSRNPGENRLTLGRQKTSGRNPDCTHTIG